jgi:hypothetical protein
MDVYAVVAVELAKASAVAIAAYVPRKARRRQNDPRRASFVPAMRPVCPVRRVSAFTADAPGFLVFPW